MKADTGTVVGFHCRISDEAGDLADDSRSRDTPIYALLGQGGLMPDLEQALNEHEVGDQVHVVLSPEQAYGAHQDGRIQRVPKKYFRDGARLKPGMKTRLSLRSGGEQEVTVHKVGMSTIDVDTNHPLAGQMVTFDIEIIEVREATPEEQAHGHAHQQTENRGQSTA